MEVPGVSVPAGKKKMRPVSATAGVCRQCGGEGRFPNQKDRNAGSAI